MKKTKSIFLLVVPLLFSQLSFGSSRNPTSGFNIPIAIATTVTIGVLTLVAAPAIILKKHLAKKELKKKVIAFAAEENHQAICELMARQDLISHDNWMTFLSKYSPATPLYEGSSLIMKYMNIPRLRDILNSCPSVKQHYLIDSRGNPGYLANLAIINEIYEHELPQHDNILTMEEEIASYARSKDRHVYSYATQLPENSYDLLK